MDGRPRAWRIRVRVQPRASEPEFHEFHGHEVRIGRVVGNELVLPHDNVSRMHCRIYVDDEGQAHIADSRSTNGTYVNDRRVVDAPFGVGDRLYLGNRVITLEGPPEALNEPDEPDA